MTSFKNVILSSSPMHLRKLQKMHQTFQNPDPVQPDSQYSYLMEKAYTTARKGAIIHFFFERLSRETYPFWGREICNFGRHMLTLYTPNFTKTIQGNMWPMEKK